MVHRITAGVIFVTVGICAWLARRQLGARHLLSRLASAWFWLIVAQICLGAATIWTRKTADITTAHVACGALSLALGGLITMISFRCLAAPARESRAAQKSGLTTLFPGAEQSAGNS
jgi:heme A synthase